MSLKRQRSASPGKGNATDSEHDYWISEKIEDRASVFRAYFSPTMPARELQNLSEIKSASHRILAWRRPSSQKTLVANVRTLETGTDDDGERYGARHVLKVLEEMRVEGALVIARWYGGQMLGPTRFSHMEDCARDAIRAWRQREDSEGQKRRRVEDEAMEMATLITELTDRDQNIKVLRELLEQKAKKAQSGEQRNPSRPASTFTVDYNSMPLERLRQLDKARDSTVAFLLKRIDEAEKQDVPEGDRKEEMPEIKSTNTTESGAKIAMPDTSEPPRTEEKEAKSEDIELTDGERPSETNQEEGKRVNPDQVPEKASGPAAS